MSVSVAIVGAGPAAAGALLQLAMDPEVSITVFDIGGRLEASNEAAVLRLRESPPVDWGADDLRLVARQPVTNEVEGLPEKRSFGSEYPFRDLGQRAGLQAAGGVNPAVISSAYGGFSNVWGAQVMPFSRRTFDDWPVAAETMEEHYAAVLRQIPFAAEDDDLSRLFPLLGTPTALPPLSERSTAVITRYERHKARLRADGVQVGKARLAFQAANCVRCQLCMTGCPYDFIYSARQTIEGFRRSGRIAYHSGVMVTRVTETDGRPSVLLRDLATGGSEWQTFDKVLIGCGAIGSTRLAMTSLHMHDKAAVASESAQFVLPFVSLRPTARPEQMRDFTLNQFNMIVDPASDGLNLAQLHFYTYSLAFAQALPGIFRRSRGATARAELLRRLSVALGYLPSWASDSFSVEVRAPRDDRSLGELRLSGGPPGTDRAFVAAVLRRIATSARRLDLWPIIPQLRFSAPGKSYHFGGTFPHGGRVGFPFSSDRQGRVGSWRHIHIVDGAVLPSIAATTFTLTIMANAHRIASEMSRSSDR